MEKRKYYLPFILAAVAFISLITCQQRIPEEPSPSGFSVQQTTELFQTVKSSFDKKMAIYKQTQDSLENQLKVSEEKLRIAKFKLHQSQLSVLDLASRDTEKQTPEQRFEDCDSLKVQVKEYVAWVDSTNAQQESIIGNLKQVIVVKDSALQQSSNVIQQTQIFLQENLQRQALQNVQIDLLQKSQKRKRTQNRLLTGGLFILSGITTTLFIKQKL